VAGWFKTGDASTLSLVVQDGTDVARVQAELRREAPGLAVFSNAHLRSEVLRIFQQTFAITFALEGIGVVVAVAGLGVTLASMLAERSAELTTLRALGMTHREIARTTAWEGALLAACGTGGGLLASLGLGALLIHVINLQTFGWTLQTRHPWWGLLGLSAAVVGSGTLVAWAVGRRGAELPVDQRG
jgi:putative ABC transport system permease protein